MNRDDGIMDSYALIGAYVVHAGIREHTLGRVLEW